MHEQQSWPFSNEWTASFLNDWRLKHSVRFQSGIRFQSDDKMKSYNKEEQIHEKI